MTRSTWKGPFYEEYLLKKAENVRNSGKTNQVIKNLKAVLNAAGGEPSNVVKTTIYLLDLKDFEKVNKIYAETFSVNA